MAKIPFRVEPGSRVKLTRLDPGDTGKFKQQQDAKDDSAADLEQLSELQELLYADGRYAVLLILQGMDTSGKDGMIRHLSAGLNLMGADVTAFGRPTDEEQRHDFLWRVHQHVPPRRMLGIFNRSHYEDVLVVRVHEMVPVAVWRRRYDQINDFERMLVENSTVIVKCFLHISKEEQGKRLRARLDDRSKLSTADVSDRENWDTYVEAYEAALSRCSTPASPWHIIPSDHKWYRNYAVTRLLIETLKGLKLKPPKPDYDPKSIKID
jgi:PPK2 family polyphosphate:nucleotide phosphotransferase